MRLCNVGHEFDYETEKVARIFLPYEKINIVHELVPGDNTAVCSLSRDKDAALAVAEVCLFGKKEAASERVEDNKSEKSCELAVA